MEISEVRRNRDVLEDSIRELIIAFEKMTSTEVEGVSIMKHPMFYTGENIGLYIRVEIKI